ncbi:hypothetical protein AGMMS50212_09530 [Spirochaetia bacterium]|nr:hypothetical protein AGMMS50212_09530 [Spirochaetia bacterium]
MDIEDLRVTASLAHLNLKQEELEAAFPAFEQMLGYFAAMQAADKDEKAFSGSKLALSHGAFQVNQDHFKKDDAILGNSELSYAGLVGNSGENDGQFIIVPNVL